MDYNRIRYPHYPFIRAYQVLQIHKYIKYMFKYFIAIVFSVISINSFSQDKTVSLPYYYSHFSEALQIKRPYLIPQVYDSLTTSFKSTASINTKRDILSFMIDSIEPNVSFCILCPKLVVNNDYRFLRNMLTEKHKESIVKLLTKDNEYIRFVGLLHDKTFLNHLQKIYLKTDTSNLNLEFALVCLDDKKIIKLWKDRIQNIPQNQQYPLGLLLLYISETEREDFYLSLTDLVLQNPDIVVFDHTRGRGKVCGHYYSSLSLLIYKFFLENVVDCPIIRTPSTCKYEEGSKIYSKWTDATEEQQFLEYLKIIKEKRKVSVKRKNIF